MYYISHLAAAIFIFSAVLTGCQTKEEEPAKNPLQTQEQKTADEKVIKVRYYDSGKVETETEYVGDKRNGMHKLFDEQGNLISVVRYENDKMEGLLKTYYSDGTLKAVVPYEKGIVNGEMIVYFETGKTFRKQIYEQGKLKSTKQYTPDGKLEFEDNF